MYIAVPPNLPNVFVFAKHRENTFGYWCSCRKCCPHCLFNHTLNPVTNPAACKSFKINLSWSQECFSFNHFNLNIIYFFLTVPRKISKVYPSYHIDVDRKTFVINTTVCIFFELSVYQFRWPPRFKAVICVKLQRHCLR